MIDLQTFCATAESDRTALYDLIQTPFNARGFTYATDGCLMMEVPLQDGYPTREAPHDGPDIIRVIKAAEVGSDMRPVPMVTFDEERNQCGMCGGSGYLVECGNCDGHGYVGADEDDCEVCGGYGDVAGNANEDGDNECPGCGGLGVVLVKRSVRLAANLIIQAKYLNQIAALPNARLLFAPKNREKPVPFTFDGGRGWVMQMRHDIEIDFDLTQKAAERCPDTEDMFS